MDNSTAPPTDVAQAISRVENYAPPATMPIESVTTAQSRIEAVAALVATAMSKAGMLELTDEQIAKLQEPFPDEAFKRGAAGKENLIYIEHAFLRQRLNQVIGIGKYVLIQRNRWGEDYDYFKRNDPKIYKATRIYVECMLLVKGCLVAEAVGDMTYYHDNSGTNYGDAVEGAKSAALRRCCKDIGIGLQAWEKDFCDGWWKRTYEREQQQRNGSRPPTTASEARPQASTKPQQAPPTGRTTPPQGRFSGVGVIVDIEEKTGVTTSTGKPWNACIVTLEDNNQQPFTATTFDKTLSFDARQCFANKLTVEFTIEPGNKPGRLNLVSLREYVPRVTEPAITSATDADQYNSDDVPF